MLSYYRFTEFLHCDFFISGVCELVTPSFKFYTLYFEFNISLAIYTCNPA